MARPDYIPAKEEKVADTQEAEHVEMAKKLRSLRDQKEKLDTELKAVNKAIDDLSIKLGETLETLGIDSFRVKDVGTIFVTDIHRPSVNDRDALIAWLDKEDMGDAAPRTVHPARLLSLVKELLEEGDPLPDGVTDFVQKRASLRRS